MLKIALDNRFRFDDAATIQVKSPVFVFESCCGAFDKVEGSVRADWRGYILHHYKAVDPLTWIPINYINAYCGMK
jgi:hypothetical protein